MWDATHSFIQSKKEVENPELTLNNSDRYVSMFIQVYGKISLFTYYYKKLYIGLLHKHYMSFIIHLRGKFRKLTTHIL